MGAVHRYLPVLCDAIAMGIIIPVLPLYALDLGASEAVTGVAVSAVALGRLAFSVPGGQLTARVGEKRAIQFGLFVYMCASVLLAVAPAVPVILLARVIAGCGQGTAGVARQAFCAVRAQHDVHVVLTPPPLSGCVVKLPMISSVWGGGRGYYYL
jgi:MFS family permease